MKLTYKLNENKDGLIVSGGDDLKGELNIPSEQKFEGKTYPVIKIENGAFEHGDRLTSLVIPSSVTEIEDSAFDSCSRLVSIVVAKGNDYYDSREDCNAIIETETDTLVFGCRSTIIPKSVTIIGDSAFAGCSRLTSIVIPNSVTKIGANDFSCCMDLATVEIPNSVTEIDDSTFYGCSELAHIDIPNSVTKIGRDAFNGCRSLFSIIIPDSVKLIEMCVFEGCDNLQRIVISDASLLSGTEYPKEAMIIDRDIIQTVIAVQTKNTAKQQA